MKRLLIALLLTLPAFGQFGTANKVKSGASLPASCEPGMIFNRTGVTSPGLYDCPASGTWRLVAAGSPVSVAAGSSGTITVNTGVSPNEVDVTDNIFGQLGGTQSWTGVNTFAVAPAFSKGFTLSPNVLWLRDDFMQTLGAGNTNLVFSKVPSGTGTSAAGGGSGAIALHPGIATIATGTTASSGGVLYWGQAFNFSAIYKDDLLQKPFVADYVFSISDVSNTETMIGFFAIGLSVNPGNRIVLRGDTAANSTFQYQTCNNSGPTCSSSDSGVTVDTSWHRLRIFRLSGDTNGTVRMCMDACGASTQLTSNITTATGYNPAAMFLNNASRTTTATLSLDYLEFLLEVGARW